MEIALIDEIQFETDVVCIRKKFIHHIIIEMKWNMLNDPSGIVA